MILLKFVFAGFRKHPARTIAIILGMSMSIAGIVAVIISAQMANSAIEELRNSKSQHEFLEVLNQNGDLLDQSLLSDLRSQAGVANVLGLVRRPVSLFWQDNSTTVMTVGIAPHENIKDLGYKLEKGDWISAPEHLMLDQGVAEGLGIAAGDTVKLLGRRGLIERTIAGTFSLTNAIPPNGRADVIVTLQDGQNLANAPRKLFSFLLISDEKKPIDDLAVQLGPTLPAGVTVHVPMISDGSKEESVMGIRYGLYISAAMTLVMAWTIMFNGFLMMLSERRKQFSILQAIGATGGQVLRLLLGEGLAIGLIAFVVGAPLGLLAAPLISSAIGSILETKLQITTFNITPFVLAFALSISGSIAAALYPAITARRISPLEGIRNQTPSSTKQGQSKVIAIVGLACLALAIALLIAFFQFSAPAPVTLPAAVFFMVGLMCMIPPTVPFLVRGLCKILARKYHCEAKLAAGQLFTNPTRTNLTVCSLGLAVIAAIAIGHIISENTRDARQWIERTIVGDFILRPLSGDKRSAPAELKAKIEAVSDVAKVSQESLVLGRGNGVPLTFVAKDFSKSSELALDIREGNTENLMQSVRDGSVIIGSVLAQRQKIAIGDMIEIEGNISTAKAKVAAITNDYALGGMVVFMDQSLASKLWDSFETTVYIVTAREGMKSKAEEPLKQLAKEHRYLLQSVASLTGEMRLVLLSLQSSFWLLLVLGMIVAAFGTFTNVSMNVIEQTREFGLLQSIGMIRTQVSRTIRYQALYLGTIAVLHGLISGTILAWVINLCMLPLFGHPLPFQLELPILIGVPAISLVIVWLAAWGPTRRAISMDIIQATRHE